MNNQNVISLPATTTLTAEQALKSALQMCDTHGLDDVLIVGTDADGELYLRSSRMTKADAVFLLETCKRWVMDGCPE